MKFYYIDESTKQQLGPFPIDQLQAKNITPETIVWRSGLQNWVRARDLQELAFLFDNRPPTPHQESDSPKTGYTNTSYRRDASYAEDQKWNDLLQMPKTWLVESILATFFCCLPLGIVGIVYASKVESYYRAGDYSGALSASNNAKQWTMISFFSMLALYFLIFLAMLLSGGSSY